MHSAIGIAICFLAMLGIYYGNVWDSKSQPFMSTALRSADGGRYPIAKVFVGGVLSKTALAEVGLPKLSGTFAYSLLMANAAVSPYFRFKQTFMPVLTDRSGRLARWSCTVSCSGEVMLSRPISELAWDNPTIDITHM